MSTETAVPLDTSISNADETPTVDSNDALPTGSASEPMIDPELMDLPPPPHLHRPESSPTNGTAPPTDTKEGIADILEPGAPMGITASIASAPNPHHTDFSYLPFNTDEGIDLEAIDLTGDDIGPGSPTAKVMRAIAPPNATQPNPQWPAPPPNASVNLYIGRALLSNGNDNWPLKPNDIVSWIRKHYPSEWDGDEGRCSAHRVRTYLARKGADMYYEKLNQGCIAGWRIRQNHLWRFENGGFQGRGMKQEEAIAQAQKENEAVATAAHKVAAAAALAQGHPGVKIALSQPGINDGSPSTKRQRTKGGAGAAQARKRVDKKKMDEDNLASLSGVGDPDQSQSYYQATEGQGHQSHHDQYQSNNAYSHMDPHASIDAGGPIDPMLMNNQSSSSSNPHVSGNPTDVDINMVHQAIAAANANAAAGVGASSGQMDELEMGMQIPIEMQMQSGHDEVGDDVGGVGVRGYEGREYYQQHSGYPPQEGGHYQGAEGGAYGYTGYQGGQ